MKTAGRILGTAFFLEGYEVQDAPIFAYVRASREIINERGVIGRPDLIVVADETLIQIPAAVVLAGAIEKTVMIIGTTESPRVWRKRLNFVGPLIVLAPPPGNRRPARHLSGSIYLSTMPGPPPPSSMQAPPRPW
jgi:pyruvate ferredoxin oxidoreductase gamma subunit